jgi:glucoamylase
MWHDERDDVANTRASRSPMRSLAMPGKRSIAPGHPGISPTWTSSAKDIVGCAFGQSRIWFTLGFGIINEVYYPRVDTPQIRDLGFIVGDGKGFWVEVKRLENYSLRLLGPGSPVIEVVHKHKRFQLTIRIAPDPDRDVLAIALSLTGEDGLLPYVLIAPRLGATGQDNTAEISPFSGRLILGAQQGPFGLALAAVDVADRDAIGQASVGYVGHSDGWQDFYRNGTLTWQYTDAGPGNVAMIASLPRQATLALGFDTSIQAAATLAISTLAQPFEHMLDRQLESWRRWHAAREKRTMLHLEDAGKLAEQFRTSLMVLRAHCDKTHIGAMVASLSVPWGNSRDDRGGYHLVWPRDLVQCATALLAVGAEQEARNTLRYLIATQNEDGSWNQNQWLGGTPYWRGIQLDQVAAPVLLAVALAERDALQDIAVSDMIFSALSFIAQTGPFSPQDRWEESPGLNAYTLATCIAALVAGSEFLPATDRKFALMLADFWNANLENWMQVADTRLSQEIGVDNYCIHVAPAEVLNDRNSLKNLLKLRNQHISRETPSDEEVSNDFLQLVRFGMREAHDPWIANSVRVADALLKVETPYGPAWHRYNGDGYGEHDDGRPFDGWGRGRAWPLLTGERGHYELLAGNDPLPYLEAMAAMAGPGGMIPEQVWDTAPIPEFRLFCGRPTGSAMPLAWAHAEFLKLIVSRQLGHPVDRPSAVWNRYEGRKPNAKFAVWCQHAPIGKITRGQSLVIATNRPARIHWGLDGWQDIKDDETHEAGFGLHIVSIASDVIGRATRFDFTIQWHKDLSWIGEDFQIAIDMPAS